MKLIVKKIAAIGIIIAAVTVAGGCSSEPVPSKPQEPNTIGKSFWGYEDKLYAETVKLEDGRAITCIVLADQRENQSIGGVSCDWDTANGLIPEEER